MLVLSVLFFATLAIMPLTKGMAIESGNPLYFFYLLSCSYIYFAWQWIHGGQTLGMQAWKIRLVCSDETPVNWPVVTRRFMLACLSLLFFGLGFIWCLIDKDKLTFHDRFSNTVLVVDEHS